MSHVFLRDWTKMLKSLAQYTDITLHLSLSWLFDMSKHNTVALENNNKHKKKY